MKLPAALLLFASLCGAGHAQTPPASYDLRNVNGTNYSTAVKDQIDGTCWTHGTMAAIESNLRKTGVWTGNGESGEPNLAEYHLDWWNGFNQHNNDDRIPPAGGGLVVHMGGDYRVAAAYITRGEGVVRDIDGQSHPTPPARRADSYHHYYPRHIEWYVDDLSPGSRDTIKRAIMNHGAIGTCMYFDYSFFSSGTHYQPPSDTRPPNHAIAIVGWDDNKTTQCADKGAWLCKNSWRSDWNGDGHFWISYFDKHACKEPQMGAVSFRDVVRLPYLNIYYHDYHGWRDTLAVNTALNAFTARTNEDLTAVSFYTAADSVDYEVRIYRQFAGGAPGDQASSATGRLDHTGFHTVDLDAKVYLTNGQPFYVFLTVSAGGQPYDRTSEVPVLLGNPVNPDDPRAFEKYLETLGKMRRLTEAGIEVVSAAGGGESYSLSDSGWVDLTNVNPTANFCIKGLTVKADSDNDGVPDDTDPDDDNDGMPDSWEAEHGYNARDAGDNNLDTDEDGALNWQEYVADTDPTNPASRFRITAIGNSPVPALYFESSASRLYTLRGADDLAGGAWSNIPGAGPRAGAGGPDSLSDTNPAPLRFYRLRVETP